MGEVKEISNKPQLRGLHHSLVKKNIFISMGLVVAVIVGMEFGFKQPRKERVAEFYRYEYFCKSNMCYVNNIFILGITIQ